jgi:hypothetical protein
VCCAARGTPARSLHLEPLRREVGADHEHRGDP